MDSSVIPLCLSLFDWAKFRTKKGGVKLHAVLDYDTGLPNYAVIGEAREHDSGPAKAHNFPSGSVVVVDRAYVDYAWLSILDSCGVRFVTRIKSNTAYKTVNTYMQADRPSNILLDSCIHLTGQNTKKHYPKRLRLLKVYDEQTNQELTLITNDFDWKAQTVSELYKARWDVEVFFKHLKQLFRIKSFVGTTDNAVRIQIWCSLIAMLLLRYLKKQAKYNWHMSNLIVFLRLNLFVKIDLYEWLHNPIYKVVQAPRQRTLFDTG
jgi:IS4 transposase